MANINWQLVVTILGGGAAGAVITNVVTFYRGRKPRIGQRLKVLPVFQQPTGEHELSATISVHFHEQTSYFDNLFIAEVEVVNQGSKDFDIFTFGLSLPGFCACIYVTPGPSDRFHKVTSMPHVIPDDPQNTVDFTLTPFNRDDSYRLKLYTITQGGHRLKADEIIIGSPHPILFVDADRAKEFQSQLVGVSVLCLATLAVAGAAVYEGAQASVYLPPILAAILGLLVFGLRVLKSK